MLLFSSLLFAIILLSAAVYVWISDTALTATLLGVIYSVVIALVIISVFYDVSLMAGFPAFGFIWASILTAGGLIFYERRNLKLSSGLSLRIFSIRTKVCSVAVLAIIIYLSSAFISYSGRWGRWDARAIWTLHALFLTDPRHWADQFTDTISWSHPDYPLMLPSFVAMFWRTLGTTDAVVPCAISYIVFLFVLLVVAYSLMGNNRWILGIAALVAFKFVNDYILWAASQGADSLLSLFILMPLVLQRWNEKNENSKLLFLMGFIAGFAGWVKNEGVSFTLIFSLAMIWQYRRAPKLLMHYAGGLVLPVLVILVFKIHYAPSNDIIGGQGQSIFSKLSDLHRYLLTARFFANNFLLLYPLLIGVVILIFLKGIDRLGDPQLCVLIAMVVVYYFIFIITPRDLAWHLETASERLFLQLFPAFVYALLSLIGEEQAAMKYNQNS